MVKRFSLTELSLIWLSALFISLQKCRHSLFPVQTDQLAGGWKTWLECKCLHLWIKFLGAHADFHISHVFIAAYVVIFFGWYRASVGQPSLKRASAHYQT